ncbi:hypothetical protein SPHINGO391_390377 [Sphingomonas aurantiaca]|uniref:Uncharacterized protein n=1 Tax=Sphingomonas aurantiaca TaxID=185949 RepID=A0A5E7YTF8_9SPHN|nr:hypothetical protein SPHINGO391_390377 [Sphingomonas aurantiaca]
MSGVSRQGGGLGRSFRRLAHSRELETKLGRRALKICDVFQRGFGLARRNRGTFFARAGERIGNRAGDVAQLNAERHDTGPKARFGAVLLGQHDHDRTEDPGHRVQDVRMAILVRADAIDPDCITNGDARTIELRTIAGEACVWGASFGLADLSPASGLNRPLRSVSKAPFVCGKRPTTHDGKHRLTFLMRANLATGMFARMWTSTTARGGNAVDARCRNGSRETD